MRTVIAVLFSLILLVGCADEDPTADGDPDQTTAAETEAEGATDGDAVTIVGFSFDPGTISAEVGDTVVWTNEDGPRHNVTADDDSFASDNLAEGETFSHTFDEPGTFDYVCTLHSGMSGTIEVG